MDYGRSVDSFEGVAQTYEKSRRGYPVALRQWLIESGALDNSSFVVDLGAGTGQLVRLLAPAAAQTVAMEPSAEMLTVGRRATADLSNVSWIQGKDSDMPAHFGSREVDLVTIGNAFHHMDQAELLGDLDDLVGNGGAVCIATSSVPVWLQDSDWSRAIRRELETVFGPLPRSGVPDLETSVSALQDSSFGDVSTWSFEQTDHRACENVVGELISSSSGELSSGMVDRIRLVAQSFSKDGALPELVQATAVLGRRPTGR